MNFDWKRAIAVNLADTVLWGQLVCKGALVTLIAGVISAIVISGLCSSIPLKAHEVFILVGLLRIIFVVPHTEPPLTEAEIRAINTVYDDGRHLRLVK